MQFQWKQLYTIRGMSDGMDSTDAPRFGRLTAALTDPAASSQELGGSNRFKDDPCTHCF